MRSANEGSIWTDVDSAADDQQKLRSQGTSDSPRKPWKVETRVLAQSKKEERKDCHL